MIHDFRHARERQIHEYGQTPSQLFKSPHPARRVMNTVDKEIIYYSPQHLHQTLIREACSSQNFTSPVLTPISPRIALMTLSTNHATGLILVPNAPKSLLKIGKMAESDFNKSNIDTRYSTMNIRTVMDKIYTTGAYCTLVPPKMEEMVVWGFCDGSLRVMSLGLAEV